VIEQKPPIITRDVLQSYLLCKVKGHLKLMGERGSPCDYETLMTELRATVAKGAADKLASRLGEPDVARDISITTSALRQGKSLILHAMVEA
jgi:hypothetical protein